ncbi:DUF6907 domain-containing protein [Streptomyces sp. NPDC054813]
MSADPRTVQVNILTTRTLEIDEPDWCVGHRDDRAQFKPDLTHYGPEHTITAPDGDALLKVMLARSPFSERSSSALELYVEAGDYTGSCDQEGIEELADAMVQGAAQLRALGRQLAGIIERGGEAQ